MASATVDLPTMLSNVLGGVRTIEVRGDTLDEALADAFRQYPGLRVHVQDESGAFRQHVLCFHNDVNTRWSEAAGVRLADGDRITILQAVSGG